MQTTKLQMNGRVQWLSVELEPMWRFCWRKPMWRRPLREIYWKILLIWNLSWHGIDHHTMHWGWSSLMVTAWSISMIFEKHCKFRTNVGESTCFVNSWDEKRYEFLNFCDDNACMLMNENVWEMFLFMQECFYEMLMSHDGMQHDVMSGFTNTWVRNGMSNRITKQPI